MKRSRARKPVPPAAAPHAWEDPTTTEQVVSTWVLIRQISCWLNDCVERLESISYGDEAQLEAIAKGVRANEQALRMRRKTMWMNLSNNPVTDEFFSFGHSVYFSRKLADRNARNRVALLRLRWRASTLQVHVCKLKSDTVGPRKPRAVDRGESLGRG